MKNRGRNAAANKSYDRKASVSMNQRMRSSFVLYIYQRSREATNTSRVLWKIVLGTLSIVLVLRRSAMDPSIAFLLRVFRGERMEKEVSSKKKEKNIGEKREEKWGIAIRKLRPQPRMCLSGKLIRLAAARLCFCLSTDFFSVITGTRPGNKFDSIAITFVGKRDDSWMPAFPTFSGPHSNQQPFIRFGIVP